jgi:hypothetical protein
VFAWLSRVVSLLAPACLGDSKDDSWLLRESGGVIAFVPQESESHFDAFGLAEPTTLHGIYSPTDQVGFDLGESADLRRVDAEHGAANAGVFVVAR